MSSTDSSFDDSSVASENEYISEYEEMSEIEADKSEKIETSDDATSESSMSSDDDAYAWMDDPVADEQWTARYEEDLLQNEIFEAKMRNRLDGTTQLNEWCNCGHCSLEQLTNWQECHCCCELDGCKEAMSSEIVKEDLGDSEDNTCVTQHPGFRPVCLEKWSLRMAAWQYKTRNKERYKQMTGEERFLRSVAYREFTRMVYGIIGKRRIPLPACAYKEIRCKFPMTKDEVFTGFEIEEDDF